MILFRENSKDTKVNTQKSITLLYTKNKLSERETKKIIQFTNTSKNIPRNKSNQGGEKLH